MRARSRRRAPFSLALLIGTTACGCGSVSTGAAGSGWISRDPEEQRLQLERQLRGFDVAMMETDHRFVELYRAGRQENWDAAAYHAAKLGLAIENGVERRPKRAASANVFLAGALADTEAAIAARNSALFAKRFDELTAGCNACHAAEKVSFIEIFPPDLRTTPIGRDGRNDTQE